mmetsp:Transcript_14838/g.19421  ORF Transcript_14838/g.19421 Transcript_14838/m.19421 type:complete len:86 (+) Transcript_14838:291-548(+)
MIILNAVVGCFSEKAYETWYGRDEKITELCDSQINTKDPFLTIVTSILDLIFKSGLGQLRDWREKQQQNKNHIINTASLRYGVFA